MRNSAHACHRRLTFANSVMAAGFLRFLASYYQVNFASTVLNSRALCSHKVTKFLLEKVEKKTKNLRHSTTLTTPLTKEIKIPALRCRA